MVQKFLEGYNCSLFVYGQTGAGKTFTMQGDLTTDDLKGVQPRCIEYLFYLLREKNEQTLVKVTYVEIYNEKIYDLLSDSEQQLNIREDLKTGVFIENVVEEVITNYQEAYLLLKKGQEKRWVAETQMNQNSSRSHTIFTIMLQSCRNEKDVQNFYYSWFNFVDLAGSEWQKQTKTQGI